MAALVLVFGFDSLNRPPFNWFNRMLFLCNRDVDLYAHFIFNNYASISSRSASQMRAFLAHSSSLLPSGQLSIEQKKPFNQIITDKLKCANWIDGLFYRRCPFASAWIARAPRSIASKWQPCNCNYIFHINAFAFLFLQFWSHWIGHQTRTVRISTRSDSVQRLLQHRNCLETLENHTSLVLISR